MPERPYVLLSCATSTDGFLDDTSSSRLVLSDPSDLDRVDALRADCDAVLIGANTVRRDNPRLLVRDPDRRAARLASGQSASPLRVVVTRSGDLPGHAQIFDSGEQAPLVLAATTAVRGLRQRLGDRAVVHDSGREPTPATLATQLHGLGVRRLMIEGGADVLCQWLQSGLVDEVQWAVSSLTLGESGRARLATRGTLDEWERERGCRRVIPSGNLTLHWFLPADGAVR